MLRDVAKGQLIVRFVEASSGIEPAIPSFVVRHLREYGR